MSNFVCNIFSNDLVMDTSKLSSMLHTVKDKIIEYQNAYVHFADSLFKDIEIRNLALVPIKISEEAERLKGSRQRSELDRKDFVNNVLVMILVFATPLILVLIILIRNNISTNRKLLSYNNEILSQKEEIQSQKVVVM